MILNSFASLDILVTGLRLLLAVILLAMGARDWWRWRSVLSADTRARLEDRVYLLGLIASVLVVLDVAAWPLFYLLLDSYVPHWQGVMCIYGVTQVGQGSIGSSRHLPGLVAAIEYLRPAVMFASGTWLLFYLLNRRTVTAPLTPRMLMAMLAMGALVLVDASAEAAYLVIPKVEQHLSVGCCSAANSLRDGSSLADYVGGRESATWIAGAVLGATTLLAGVMAYLPSRRHSRLMLLALAAGSGVTFCAGAWLLREVAAPRLLGLPQHQCVYCLFTHVPESIITALFLVLGAFAHGWAVMAELAQHSETSPTIARWRGTLLRCGFWSYLGFALMLSWELWLAAT